VVVHPRHPAWMYLPVVLYPAGIETLELLHHDKVPVHRVDKTLQIGGKLACKQQQMYIQYAVQVTLFSYMRFFRDFGAQNQVLRFVQNGNKTCRGGGGLNQVSDLVRQQEHSGDLGSNTTRSNLSRPSRKIVYPFQETM
jgi:hypothetical protein